MLRKIAICAGMLGIAAPAFAGTTSEPTPTNDHAVTYQWTLEESWRPACSVHVTDAAPFRDKHVSISYRNQAGSRIDLTVRMNPGDPHIRLISGCVAVDQVLIARR